MDSDNRFIAEFERHHGTIVMYPFRKDIWRDNAYYMRKYIVQLAQCIAQYEHVYLICRECDFDKLQYLKDENITLVKAEYDDIWARDIGPTFIRNKGNIVGINWKFNAWGGKKEGSYFPWDKDDSFATEMCRYFGIKKIDVGLTVEGGGILTDGAGTLFTTRSVLLNRNRNPFKSLKDVDNILKKNLHVNNIIWLSKGLARDETNGHIDNVMSVVRPHEICLAWTDNPKSQNYRRVREIEREITESYKCIIHKIPLPAAQYMVKEEAEGLEKRENSLERKEGDILPASYLNYYYVNNAVIIPAFGCKEDAKVFKKFCEIFPDRKVIQIYSREPLLGGGGIHCILHEIPER